MTEIENTDSFRPSPRGLRINRRRLLFIAFVIAVLLLALAFPFIDFKLQMVLILMPIALIVVIGILKNPYIGICLFFLYQFGRPDSFIPAMRPLKVAMMIEILTLLSWITHLTILRKRPVWTNFNWIFLAFIVVIGTTVYTAWNNQHAYDIFQSMAINFMIFVIAINVVDSLKRLNRLVWILFIVHFYFALKGIVTGGLVGGSLMGDENDFALAMNMMIPFAFFMFLGVQNKIKKFGILLILIALALAVIASMSRGGWVGLMVTIVFCIIKSKKIFTGLSMTVILAVAIVLFAPSQYWAEIDTITDVNEATAVSRINYWKAALRMFRDYPLTGVGADNGGIRMPGYVTGFRDGATQWGRTFHGTLPQILAELGGLGIISYFIMIFYAIKYLNIISRRKNKDPDDNSAVLANAIMGSIISYLTTATFLSTAYYPQLWTLYTLTMILVTVTNTNVSEIAEDRTVSGAKPMQ